MLLAADIGNSFIKFAIYDEAALLHHFSIPTSRDHSHQLNLFRRSSREFDRPISAAIICSVVPESSDALLDLLEELGIPTIVASSELDVGLLIMQQASSALGSDRFVNAFSAMAKYGAPAIICSFGTATTIDVVDESKTLLGGIIAPGFRTMARSLHQSTAQLPEVPIEIPTKLIGDTTGTAVLSGVVFGHIAMVEGLLSRITSGLNAKPLVLATGGFAPLVASMSESMEVVDEYLTLDGLRLLYERLTPQKPQPRSIKV